MKKISTIPIGKTFSVVFSITIILVLFGNLPAASAQKAGSRKAATAWLTKFVNAERQQIKQGRQLPGSRSFFWRHRSTKDSSKGVILLVHGFTEWPAQGIEQAKALYRAGYDIFAVRQAGHGHMKNGQPDSSKLPTASSYSRYSARVEEVFSSLTAYAGGKVNLVGLSLGGTACLHLLTMHPESVDRVVLHAPFLNHSRPLLRVVSALLTGAPPSSRKMLDFIMGKFNVKYGKENWQKPGYTEFTAASVLGITHWVKDTRIAVRHIPADSIANRLMVITTQKDDQAHNGTTNKTLGQLGAKILQFPNNVGVNHAMWHPKQVGPSQIAKTDLPGLTVGFFEGNHTNEKRLIEAGTLQQQ